MGFSYTRRALGFVFSIIVMAIIILIAYNLQFKL